MAYDDKVMDVVLSRKENICFSKAPSIKNMIKIYKKKQINTFPLIDHGCGAIKERGVY